MVLLLVCSSIFIFVYRSHSHTKTLHATIVLSCHQQRLLLLHIQLRKNMTISRSSTSSSHLTQTRDSSGKFLFYLHRRHYSDRHHSKEVSQTDIISLMTFSGEISRTAHYASVPRRTYVHKALSLFVNWSWKNIPRAEDPSYVMKMTSPRVIYLLGRRSNRWRTKRTIIFFHSVQFSRLAHQQTDRQTIPPTPPSSEDDLVHRIPRLTFRSIPRKPINVRRC